MWLIESFVPLPIWLALLSPNLSRSFIWTLFVDENGDDLDIHGPSEDDSPKQGNVLGKMANFPRWVFLALSEIK